MPSVAFRFITLQEGRGREGGRGEGGERRGERGEGVKKRLLQLNRVHVTCICPARSGYAGVLPPAAPARGAGVTPTPSATANIWPPRANWSVSQADGYPPHHSRARLGPPLSLFQILLSPDQKSAPLELLPVFEIINYKRLRSRDPHKIGRL